MGVSICLILGGTGGENFRRGELGQSRPSTLSALGVQLTWRGTWASWRRAAAPWAEGATARPVFAFFERRNPAGLSFFFFFFFLPFLCVCVLLFFGFLFFLWAGAPTRNWREVSVPFGFFAISRVFVVSFLARVPTKKGATRVFLLILP